MRRVHLTRAGISVDGAAPSWGRFERERDPLLATARTFVAPRNPRLERLERQTVAALVAAHFALEGAPRPDILVLGVEDGSAAADRAFWRTASERGGALASPLLFSATLPSAIAGELAMTFELLGPCIVLAGAGAFDSCSETAVPDIAAAGTSDDLRRRLEVRLRGWDAGIDGEACAGLSEDS